MRFQLKIISILFLFFLSFSNAFAVSDSFIDCVDENLNKKKDLVFYSDKAIKGFVDERFLTEINKMLIDFSYKTSNQIILVITHELCGYTPNQYATNFGDWKKAGAEDLDNGVVFLLKFTGGQGERKAYLAVGKGLEGVLTDAEAYEIIQYEAIQNFKKGNYKLGIKNSLKVVMQLAAGEYSYEDYIKNKQQSKSFLFVVLAFMFLVMILLIFSPIIKETRKITKEEGLSFKEALPIAMKRIAERNKKKKRSRGRRNDDDWWIGGGFGGGGGFSSGGGSSFGGFGGGSFGGGGAGGSW